jgi:DNA polymerase-3 subunit alpha
MNNIIFDYYDDAILKELEKIQQISTGIQKNFDYKQITLEDRETLNAFVKGKTSDIFKFSSSNMKRFLKAFLPEHFSDLIYINAMYRPGLIYHIPDVIKSKKTGHYRNDFPDCEVLLKETYGIPVYQEQITQMFQTFADYSPEEAELLLHVMKIKKVEVLLLNKQEFLKRTAHKRIITANQANDLFDILVPFAGYACNKSQIISYTIIAWLEMYLKVHYPKEFKNVNN